MTFNKALNLITSIQSVLNNRIKFSYDLSSPCKYKLEIYDSKTEQSRYISFKLKKGVKKMVYVTFTCHDFHFDFPLKKNVKSMSFNIYDFELLLKYGIENGMETSEKSSSGANLYVEF